MSVAFAGTAYDVLRLRDGVECSAVAGLRDELLALTDPALEPAWVPMRAADCLVELYAQDPVVVEAMLPWMTDPARGGLALVVVDRIDAFAVADAVRLVEAGLSGTQKARIERKLRGNEVAEIRALVDATGAGR